MKYFIVGFNASGKQRVIEDLSDLGVRVGKIFRSIENVADNIYTLSSTVYSKEDINNIFESKSYIFFSENKQGTESFYEGLSFYEYDNNDVFIISPEQFNLIPHFDDNVMFIWLDNNNKQRRDRFLNEKRKYNFAFQESLEKQDIHDFINRINDMNHLYFVNEEPSRISAIVYSLIQHPDLIDIFKKRFN